MYGIIQSTLAKLHHPLVEDHLVLETIFIWIQVWSLKRGTTVLYYSTKITKISTPQKYPPYGIIIQDEHMLKRFGR